MNAVGQGFLAFGHEFPQLAQAHFGFIKAEHDTSALDEKTQELAYLSVLAATRLTGGIAFHVDSAKKLGATRAEVLSAILVGMPAVGLAVLDALPEAIEAYDSPSSGE